MIQNSVRVFTTLLVLIFGLPAAADDSATLQAILNELRQLRQDLQDITLATARLNDLENRLQFQRERVKKAELKLEQASNNMTAAESRRNMFADELKTSAASLAAATDQQERHETSARNSYLQKSLEALGQELIQDQSSIDAARQGLNDEQKKLESMEQGFDRTTKQLGRVRATVPR